MSTFESFKFLVFYFLWPLCLYWIFLAIFLCTEPLKKAEIEQKLKRTNEDDSMTQETKSNDDATATDQETESDLRDLQTDFDSESSEGDTNDDTGIAKLFFLDGEEEENKKHQ